MSRSIIVLLVCVSSVAVADGPHRRWDPKKEARLRAQLGMKDGPAWAPDQVITPMPALGDKPVVLSGAFAAGAKTAVMVLKIDHEVEVTFTSEPSLWEAALRGPLRDADDLAPWHEGSTYKPGFYVIEVRRQTSYMGAMPFSIVARDPSVHGQPDLEQVTLKTATAPADLPLETRRACIELAYTCGQPAILTEYLPAAIRQRMFSAVSRALFVYAAHDLDRDTGMDSIVGSPKKNEPLLVIANSTMRGDELLVLAADGAEYHVNKKELRLDPDGAAVLPERARPLNVEAAMSTGALKLERAKDDTSTTFVTLDGDPAKLLAQHKKIDDAYHACINKYLDQYGGRNAGDFDIVTYRNGKVAKIENAKDVAWDKIDAHCHLDRAEKQLAAIEEKLVGPWQAARQAKLDEIRASWK